MKWAPPPLHWRAVPGQPRAQATAPRYGSEQVGLGWVISGGVLDEENLSAHVQAYVMHRGARLGHVRRLSKSRSGGRAWQRRSAEHTVHAAGPRCCCTQLARACERFARLSGVKQHGSGRRQSELARCRVHALRSGRPRSGDVCFKKQRSAAPAAPAAPAARASLVDRGVDARRRELCRQRRGRAAGSEQQAAPGVFHTTAASAASAATRCC